MAHYTDLSIDGTSDRIPTQGGFNDVGAAGMCSTQIKDNAVVNEAALNKMATSIPTPFARLYLYDTAFRELNAQEAIPENRGRAYNCNPQETTLYHHLVSECLDMLEFIFEYGEDSRFTIHEWNVNVDPQLLGVDQQNQVIATTYIGANNTPTDITADKHKKLGTALRDAIINTSLNSNQQIFIFKWDGEIVGGTSPYTLVYTSPNWRRIMNAHGRLFYGGIGNQLFAPVSKASQVYSLIERSDEFRTYFYALILRYAQMQTGTFTNLYTYVYNTRNNYEISVNGLVSKALSDYTTLVQAYNRLATEAAREQRFAEDYKQIKDTTDQGGTPERPVTRCRVTSAGIPFFTKVVHPDAQSAYRIRPTVDTQDLPIETTSGGIRVNMAEKLPLVLSTACLAGNARYWYNTPYQPSTLPARQDKAYFERVLPGVAGNPEYPYLTECDFLEDSIMWLGYQVDRDRFFTGYEGDCGFLLPLKPTFFKYFTVNDLSRMVHVSPKPFPMSSEVTITLDIPVAGGSVHFCKTYKREDQQYVDFAKNGSIKLGIFPFYTYRGTPAEEEDVYKVMLARMCDGVSLEFYNKDFVNPLSNEIVSHAIRTQSTERHIVTEYYTVGTHFVGNGNDANAGGGSFTAIRVVKDGIGGMIVPLFRQANVSTDKYVFCVDFGTANTNVAYAKAELIATPNGNQEPCVNAKKIHTLQYSKENSQVAMLNEVDSEGTASDLNRFISSEFFPSGIGNGNGNVHFPIRTIACRKQGNLPPEARLFGDINIALYIDKYRRAQDDRAQDYEYETELKWNPQSRRLIGPVYRELLWMCKNKVAELGGDPKFEFYYTYPQTMSDLTIMKRGWSEAANAVRCRCRVFDPNNVRAANGLRMNLYEGIAPWYHAVSDPEKQIFSNQRFLNIDIGGGSTDAIYITSPLNAVVNGNRIMQGYSFSAKFAADDLWGSGVVANNNDINNGFITAYERDVYPNLAPKMKNKYRTYKTNTNATDIISYLFSDKNISNLSNNDKFGFADMIENNANLRVPLLFHFAATIYYVACTLANQQLAIPEHISFSGMGSLYIKYLTEDTAVLSGIIKSIFKYVGLSITDNDNHERALSIHFTENPKKVTAEGGVLMFNATRNGLIEKYVSSEELNFHLYSGEVDEESDVTITGNNVNDYKERTTTEVEHFLKLYKDESFRRAIARLNGTFPTYDVDNLRQYISDGFDLARVHEHPDLSEAPLKDVLFFWPLKHVLNQFAIDMAARTNNTNP